MMWKYAFTILSKNSSQIFRHLEMNTGWRQIHIFKCYWPIRMSLASIWTSIWFVVPKIVTVDEWSMFVSMEF